MNPEDSHIVHEESEFIAHGGRPLYCQSWRSKGSAIASLIIVHGLSEHSGRYAGLVTDLVPGGVNVYAFDHRGHGRSAINRRAHVNNWSEYREDLRAFVERIAAREADRPLFLMGHSMGGLVAANYVLHYPLGLRGVILSAPPLGDVGVSPILRLAGKMIATIKPDAVFKSGLALKGISRDAMAVEEYRDDPLIHGKVTARWSVEFFRAIKWSRERAADFKPPVLIFHGDADILVPIEASRNFYQQIEQPDKTYITYKGGYHESLSDIHSAQVLVDIKSWLLERI